MKYLSLIALGLSILVLQGCISREQADKKLAEACAAGVQALLPEGSKVEKTQMAGFSEYEKTGKGSRKVDLKLAVSDGFAAADKDYTCVFFEEFGPFNMSMSATVYQLQMDGELIGQDELRAAGTPEQIEKLNKAVAAVLDQ